MEDAVPPNHLARFSVNIIAHLDLSATCGERYEAEQAEYAAKGRAYETKRKPRGRNPKPPSPGPHDKEPYTFTDFRPNSVKPFIAYAHARWHP